MEVGADALLIGVGPGAACTSREVLASACRRSRPPPMRPPARGLPLKKTGRYIPSSRRRDDDGRRTCARLRLPAPTRDDRLGLRARDRGARARLSLGHGDAAREPAAGHAIRVGIAGSPSRSCSGGLSRKTARSTSSGPSAPAWARWRAQSIRELQQTELIIAPTIKTRARSSSRRRSWGVHARGRAAREPDRRPQRGWAVLPPHRPPHP